MNTNDLLPAALVSTGSVPAARPQVATKATPHQDAYASQAGPDVSFNGPDGVTEAYAVFQIDPESKQLQVVVVDSQGQVLRMIPSKSVSEMMDSMSRYRP